MAGVNDLIPYWNRDEARWMTHVDCADGLSYIAETAWHPVSEPPTEEDANQQSPSPLVMVRWSDGDVTAEEWDDVASKRYVGMTHWARIRDVVLLPPEEP